MKKFFTVCIFCLIIIMTTYYFCNNPEVLKGIISPIANKIEEYTVEKEIPYTSDFKINDINIKNNDYYYNTLTQNEQTIYKSLANSVKDLKTEFVIQDYEFSDVDTAMKDVEKALHKFLLDHPEVFYLNDKYSVSTTQSILGNKVSLKVSYTVESLDELNIKIEEIKNGIEEIINLANISNDNIFDNELKLHDILGKNVKYYEYENINDIPHYAHTIYGAFVQKNAVCDGLSKSMQILLDKVDIDSIVLTGTLNNESHAWNMVKLNNEWYNLDITSDKSIKDYNDVVIHSYFNITTDKIKESHTIDEEDIVPIASSTQLQYFVALDKVITSADNFNTKLNYILRNNNDTEKVEFEVQNINGVPEKTIEVLRKGKYNQYLGENMTKFVYYNILDDYIIIKN